MASENADHRLLYRVSNTRVILSWLCVLLCLGFLVGRLLWIQVLFPDPLIKAGNARVVRNYHFEPARGLITDRFGKILAISVPVKSVAADPKVLSDDGVSGNAEKIAQAAAILEIDAGELAEKLKDPFRRFVHLKNYLEADKAAALKKISKHGFILNDSYRRFYPTGEVNAPLVGILNGEGDGVYGVEQSFNRYLTAQSSTKVAHKDRYDHVIENLGTVQEGAAGGNLVLSIDDRLQALAYEQLKDTVDRHKAEYGSAVLMDVTTGEILALVSYPSFDPNDRSHFKSANAGNRAAMATFEPGSTLKPFVALAALEAGATNWKEVFNTRPYAVDGKMIRDSHYMDYGTIKEIIQYSSNTGMAQLSQRIGPHKSLDMLMRFGFGHKSASGLIGESNGRLNENRQFWAEIDKATLGFGYGVTVTNLQLASAYATLANDGAQYPVTILKAHQRPQPKQVANAREVRRMQAALEEVVAEGTGKQGAINRYRVAAKTGTAKIARAGSYGDQYMSTYAGFAPLSGPRFAMVAVIKAPSEGGYYGGKVAGPMFSEVMARALQLYNVPPDRAAE